MLSTTLMTFLLTTNPNVRSVKLLGSWDNFSKPYAMERDRRVGAGVWRGCHTFTDIMGDGPPNDRSQWRTGGLKMGATYWYYYLLDDDVEHFNEAEPVTTKCPLLPGQPVNVLNVPIILPDSRSHGRSMSNSSEKLEIRTMNPEDKYLNPRKPPKPTLPLLNTSKPQRSATAATKASPRNADMVHRSVSQPSSAVRRKNGNKDARSVSPPRSRGPRSAFRNANEDTPKRPDPVQQVNAQSLARLQNGTVDEHRNGVGPETPVPATIQTRRAMKAGAGDAGRAALTVETGGQQQPKQPKQPSNSNGSSGGQSTPTRVDTMEKRLPTLPNTPSSVMDEAVRAIDETDKAMNAEVLRSHFSSLTTVEDSTQSRFAAEESRFSEWSTDTEEHTSPGFVRSASTVHDDQTHDKARIYGGPISPALETASTWKTPDLSVPTDLATSTDPNTPHLTVHSKPSSPNSALDDIPPWNSSLLQLAVSLSEAANLDVDVVSGLGIENLDEVESNPKRHAALFSAIESMQALALARSRSASPMILSEEQQREFGAAEQTIRDSPQLGEIRSLRPRPAGASLHPGGAEHGKTTMQELMDELSYLKNVIQAEMDGEPF
ncbi:uncharacterized protein PFLUO_LOCUS1103 [Penicillium psychrofluorescens]|uniref:uncharacterized protein n=1 Tax=Penicillium psychrofluorescens TaxID=3158075 RepID=UPI003CCE39A9